MFVVVGASPAPPCVCRPGTVELGGNGPPTVWPTRDAVDLLEVSTPDVTFADVAES